MEMMRVLGCRIDKTTKFRGGAVARIMTIKPQ
jgi:hypothetical protein